MTPYLGRSESSPASGPGRDTGAGFGKDDPRPGDVLRALRGDRSQAEVARAIGVSRSLICRIERGERTLSPYLARCLDVLFDSGTPLTDLTAAH